MLDSQEFEHFQRRDLGRRVRRGAGCWALAGSNLYECGVDADDGGGGLVAGEEGLRGDYGAFYVCLREGGKRGSDWSRGRYRAE